MKASQFKDRLLATASAMAESVSLPMLRVREPEDDIRVTPKASRKHVPYRRIIKYERSGPFQRQVGIKRIAGKELPLMQTYFEHRYLHATKGPRLYTGGPSIRLPFAPQAATGAARFYGGISARRRQAIAQQAREAKEHGVMQA